MGEGGAAQQVRVGEDGDLGLCRSHSIHMCCSSTLFILSRPLPASQNWVQAFHFPLIPDACDCRSICPEHLFLARGRKLKLGHLTDAVHFGIQDMCERLGLLDYMAPEVLAVQVRPWGSSSP